MNDILMRGLAVAIPVVAIAISGYFRKTADRRSGGSVSTRAEARPIFLALRIGGLLVWLSPLLYAANPEWMSWSSLGLPDWVRWFGATLAVCCIPLIIWMFRHLGSNITPTVLTRERHDLVTTGPYRWIRHPLYTFGASLFVGLGLLMDSWFVLAAALGAFVLLARRTGSEEAHLVARFGDEYRQYMLRTGKYLPRLWQGGRAEQA